MPTEDLEFHLHYESDELGPDGEKAGFFVLEAGSYIKFLRKFGNPINKEVMWYIDSEKGVVFEKCL